MAESEGFEPPIALRLCLISSQVHSTGLCHLSAFITYSFYSSVEYLRAPSRWTVRCPFWCPFCISN